MKGNIYFRLLFIPIFLLGASCSLKDKAPAPQPPFAMMYEHYVQIPGNVWMEKCLCSDEALRIDADPAVLRASIKTV